MKVIIAKDNSDLGRQGDIVDVAPGYARNYLLPRKLVYPATDHHIKILQDAREKQRRQEEKELIEARRTAEILAEGSYTLAVAAGEEDRLYGSVSAADISEALGKEGQAIDKSRIQLEEPIKKLGIYSIPVNIPPGVETMIKVWVVKK